MGLSNYPSGVSSFGFPVFPGVNGGYPIVGNIFFVDSNGVGAADNNSVDGSFDQPYATLNFAVSRCTADNGDFIFLKPGHVEDIGDTSTSGAIDLDVAGVSVVGLGHGSLRARFDFNDADSDFIIGASNVTIDNVHFVATVTGVKLGVAVETTNTNSVIRNCKFSVETTTTDEFLIPINYTVACNDFLIEGCDIDMGLGGAATGVKLVGATDGGKIKNTIIKGDYSQACVAGITTLSTEIYIDDCFLINGASGDVGAVEVIEMLTGTTGAIRRCTILSDVATHLLMVVADTMFVSECFSSDDVGSAADSIRRGLAASVTASADA